MKILMLIPDLNVPGGKATYVSALYPYLKNDLVTFEYGSRGKKEGKAAKFLRMIKDYLGFAFSIIKERPQVIHVNPSLNGKSFFRDSIFTKIALIFNAKVFVQWHGWDLSFEEVVERKYMWVFRFSFLNTNSMSVLAPEFGFKLKQWGFQGNLIEETTMVEDALFAQSTHSHTLHNRESVNLLFLSRVESYKGINELVEAFKIILDKGFPDVELNIAGTGSALEETKKKVKELGIFGHVHFLHHITGDKKIDALESADVFVFPTYAEGFPISLLEAMAKECVIVTTPVGGIKTFFVESKMGVSVEPRSVSSLVQGLEIVLSKRGGWKDIGAFNREYCRTHFHAERVAARLLKHYEQIQHEA